MKVKDEKMGDEDVRSTEGEGRVDIDFASWCKSVNMNRSTTWMSAFRRYLYPACQLISY